MLKKYTFADVKFNIWLITNLQLREFDLETKKIRNKYQHKSTQNFIKKLEQETKISYKKAPRSSIND